MNFNISLPFFINADTVACASCNNNTVNNFFQLESCFAIKSKLLKAEIIKNSKLLYKIFSQVQPCKLTKYEIERLIKTLDTINKNDLFFTKKVKQISVFMPSNLPLYSLILFGIIPSFMASNKLIIKPNQFMREKNIFEKIFDVLGIEKLFKNIQLVNHETQKFIDQYVPESDIIIFTGYNKNRDKILSLIKPGCLLIYNGSGHNPIVVGRNANIDIAAKDACYAKFFNSGQDCAGPDAILVHESVYDNFMEKYLAHVKMLKVGNYDVEDVDVGPIIRKSELQKFLNILYSVHSDKMRCGGSIDMKQKIVNPTVIAADLSENNNQEEIFGPISFVYRYTKDEDVRLYFNDKNGTYIRNKMYISLYGKNQFISSRDDSILWQFCSSKNGIGIVLYNKNIHDFEEGDKEYGGYSIGASGIFYKKDENITISKAMPIYIPEIIALHVDQALFKSDKQIRKTNERLNTYVIESFTANIQRIISNDNHIFAFIFGSFANGKARFSVTDASDLDIFVCLKERNPSQEEIFKKWVIKFQWEVGLKPDLDYCCEIISLNELKISLNHFNRHPIHPYHNDETTFDSVIHLCALAGPKTAIIGDKKLLSKLTSQANKEIKLQSEIFIRSLESSVIINQKMASQNGLNQKTDVLQLLKKYFKRGEHGRIIRDFIPLGGERIVATQDDLNYCKTVFYDKHINNCNSHALV